MGGCFFYWLLRGFRFSVFFFGGWASAVGGEGVSEGVFSEVCCRFVYLKFRVVVLLGMVSFCVSGWVYGEGGINVGGDVIVVVGRTIVVFFEYLLSVGYFFRILYISLFV